MVHDYQLICNRHFLCSNAHVCHNDPSVRYDFLSSIFPWPVQLKYYEDLEYFAQLCRPTLQLDIKLIHPYSQLQSVIADAGYLNFALNCPFGIRYSVFETFCPIF